MIKEPAIAKDDTSIPKMPSNGLPINKKARSIKNETRVTFVDLISPDLALISMIIGIDPWYVNNCEKDHKSSKDLYQAKMHISKFGAKIIKSDLFLPPDPPERGKKTRAKCPGLFIVSINY